MTGQITKVKTADTSSKRQFRLANLFRMGIRFHLFSDIIRLSFPTCFPMLPDSADGSAERSSYYSPTVDPRGGQCEDSKSSSKKLSKSSTNDETEECSPSFTSCFTECSKSCSKLERRLEFVRMVHRLSLCPEPRQLPRRAPRRQQNS